MLEKESIFAPAKVKRKFKISKSSLKRLLLYIQEKVKNKLNFTCLNRDKESIFAVRFKDESSLRYRKNKLKKNFKNSLSVLK